MATKKKKRSKSKAPLKRAKCPACKKKGLGLWHNTGQSMYRSCRYCGLDQGQREYEREHPETKQLLLDL